MGFSGSIQRRGLRRVFAREDMQLRYAGAVGELHLYHRFFPAEFLAGNAADRFSCACHVPGLNEILRAAGEQHFKLQAVSGSQAECGVLCGSDGSVSGGEHFGSRSQPIIQPCRETPRADCEALASVALTAGVKLAQRRHRSVNGAVQLSDFSHTCDLSSCIARRIDPKRQKFSTSHRNYCLQLSLN